MTPIRVMLDSSASRNLEHRQALIDELTQLSDDGAVLFVVCRTVSDELWTGARNGKGPGTPPIPVTYVANTVGNADMACCDSIGDGEAFEAHLHGATSIRRKNDALIADATRWHADVLVSDDVKCVRRFRRAVPEKEAISLNELMLWLRKRLQQN